MVVDGGTVGRDWVGKAVEGVIEGCLSVVIVQWRSVVSVRVV